MGMISSADYPDPDKDKSVEVIQIRCETVLAVQNTYPEAISKWLAILPPRAVINFKEHDSIAGGSVRRYIPKLIATWTEER